MKLATIPIIATLVLVFGFLAIGILLQIFLSRRQSRWPGLVLPVLSFLYSLLFLCGMVAYDSTLATILHAFFVMVITNIPTIILLAIYRAAREKLYRKSELDKMHIDDL